MPKPTAYEDFLLKVGMNPISFEEGA